MNAPLSQEDLLDVMANCRLSVDADNLEKTLVVFAERLARVAGRLTAVELAGFVLIGAAIGKHIKKEAAPALKLIVFRKVERPHKLRFYLQSIR